MDGCFGSRGHSFFQVHFSGTRPSIVSCPTREGQSLRCSAGPRGAARISQPRRGGGTVCNPSLGGTLAPGSSLSVASVYLRPTARLAAFPRDLFGGSAAAIPCLSFSCAGSRSPPRGGNRLAPSPPPRACRERPSIRAGAACRVRAPCAWVPCVGPPRAFRHALFSVLFPTNVCFCSGSGVATRFLRTSS